MKVCSRPGCPNLHPGPGRCPTCRAKADTARGNRHARGYGPEHDAFRDGVLQKHPTCVCTDQAHGHAQPCGAPSTVADHYPLDKRELRRRGLNEHDPRRGRGLCASCHGSETAKHQPGGWNRR